MTTMWLEESVGSLKKACDGRPENEHTRASKILVDPKIRGGMGGHVETLRTTKWSICGQRKKAEKLQICEKNLIALETKKKKGGRT